MAVNVQVISTPGPSPTAQLEAKIEDQRQRFLTNMQEFSSTLEAWTGMVKGQITELSQTFTALRSFSDSLPGLLDAMQSLSDPDHMLSATPQSEPVPTPQAHNPMGGATGTRQGPRVCQKPPRPGLN